MARIGFITCPSEDYLRTIDERDRKRFPHLGLLCLATYLQRMGHECKIFDLWKKNIKWHTFINEVDLLGPDLIGFNVHTESYEISIGLSRRLKQRYPEAKIVWGGAFPTFAYKELLKNGCIDFIVRFEGELVLAHLLEHIANPGSYHVEAIPGLAYRKGDTVVVNLREKPIPDLNMLPYPDRQFICFEEYYTPITISTTRGCPSACIFCSARAFWPGKVRYRSAEDIFHEVMSLYDQYGLLEFVIVDDTFTALPRRTIEFCKHLEETGIPFLWSCESRADVATGELLEPMFRAGCREIQFGVESCCPDILKFLGKGVTVEQIRNAFSLAHEIGFHSIGSFILGHAWDTVETMKRTLDFVLDLRNRFGVAVYGSTNTPFPGCYQYEHAQELGIRIHARSWGEFRLNNPIISTRNFSLDDLREIFFYSRELLDF